MQAINIKTNIARANKYLYFLFLCVRFKLKLAFETRNCSFLFFFFIFVKKLSFSYYSCFLLWRAIGLSWTSISESLKTYKKYDRNLINVSPIIMRFSIGNLIWDFLPFLVLWPWPDHLHLFSQRANFLYKKFNIFLSSLLALTAKWMPWSIMNLM